VAFLLLIGQVAILPTSKTHAFQQRTRNSGHTKANVVIRTSPSATATATTTTKLFGIVKPYDHQGYKCSYRYRPGSIPPESDPSAPPYTTSLQPPPPPPPIVLLHPIGIGQSSWYYKQLINYWNGPNALYAPDLLGCGLENGNDEWNPGAEVPARADQSTTLAYVEAIETLIHEKIVGGGSGGGSGSSQTCVLVSQGGLAPVAIELAKRHPQTISHLILITPPTWKEITQPLPLQHRFKKYKAYTSPVSYTFYDALETPLGFKAYMRRYFKRRPDDQFVGFATERGRVTKQARGTIASFNSGALFDRSYEEELRSIEQPTLILVGDADDKRNREREEYLRNMPNAVMATIDGKAALPWESPVETRNVLRTFVEEHSAAGGGSGKTSHHAVTAEGDLDDGEFVWGSYGEDSSGGAILDEIMAAQESGKTALEDDAKSSKIVLNMPEPLAYQHEGYTLTYRHKPAEPGQSYFYPTLLLVHGIGVGQSSWFWEKIFERYPGEIIAPDLIGCGLENGGDPWGPAKRNLQVPLSWVQGIERLMQNKGFNQMHRCVVVAQNGVAPIGIKLATRNEGAVSHLVLLSPPCWERLTTEFTTEDERRRRHMDNMGPPADFYFNYLESKVGYRLKIREFFKSPPEDRYVNIATAKERTTKEARNPIISYNSGDLFHRSFEEDLKRLQQPTLIVAGSADKIVKNKQRPGFGLAPYSTKMSNEMTSIIDGKVMLPWESPDDVMKELRTFLGIPSQENDAAVKNMFTTAGNLQ